MNKFKNIIRNNILENNKLSLILEDKCLRDIEETSLKISHCLDNGGTIFLCGNGGSASDSQNFASELVGKFRNERKALRAIALTADSSILTNIANDFSYKFIFSRQIQALGKEGDILFSISSSGQSPNVIEAIKVANNLNLTTISLLGKGGGEAIGISQASIVIPSESTARVQEMHILVIHILCELIETQLEI